MALEDIFRALEDQGREECDEILTAAREQASAIQAEAQAEAETVRQSMAEQAERVLRRKSSTRVNAVRLTGRKRAAGIKQQAVDDVFERALSELATARGSESYRAVFSALLDEALAGVEGEFEVLVDPADESLARTVLSEKGLDAPVRPEIQTAGGVVVSIQGGRVNRRNTFEERLTKVRRHLQADVAETLFA